MCCSNKIAAVVVTYNRKKLLGECLQSLLKQTSPLDCIIVVDNASTDGTAEFLKENNYFDNPIINYVLIPENTGGAGGFHAGVRLGYEKGFEWLWLMDDDAEPKEDALEKMEPYFKESNISALANLKVDNKGNILYKYRGYFFFEDVFKHIVKPIKDNEIKDLKYIEIDHASFVGILINRKAIEMIGFPKREFFIHYDDLEYCIRLRQVGKILLICDSIIIHKEELKKDLIEKKYFGLCLRG
ncbi:MAG: Galactofuranosyl transferase GlfT1 [Pelotomaculum sp. PtaB.Bin104]|nr:MAG: Galactofuranosyl transferase GlfT1 [Pelotomaculum sp. PtaB.Bin104]